MKNLMNMKKPAGLVLVCANVLLVSMVLAGVAQAAIQCYECHGTAASSDFRPRDAASRNDATGAFVGNHQTHMAAPASATACLKCHNTNGYTASHRNGFINLTTNINSSPLKGKYMISGSQVVAKAQSTAPTLGTCTNVNCHFEATTPQWGSPTFTSPTDCDKCHGAPPSGGASGAAGSHNKHDQYYPGATNCQKCHSNNTTFQHATSAGKRNLNISFAAAPNNGGGAYSGALNDYMPSQTNTFGTCTATYCHSPGDKASAFNPPATVPTWGGAALTCKDCHKADFASGSPMSSGSHDKHVNYNSMNTIACNKCHAATVGSSMTIVDTAVHVNGKINIKFNSLTTAVNGTYNGQATPYAKDPGTGFGQCNNVYCHSTIQSGANGTGAPTYKTPTWGNSGTGACGTCHNEGPHTFGATISTGSHTIHLSQSYGGLSNVMKCAICHNIGGKTLTAGAGCDSTFCHNAAPAKHANGLIEININPYYGGSANYNGSMVPRAGFSTCSNVSCHNNTTTPTWGTASPIGCTGCHPLNALGGFHNKHVDITTTPTLYNYTANRSTATAYNFGCSNCHPVDVSNHWNNVVNLTLKKDEAGVGTLRSKNSATAAGLNIINSGITGTTKTNIVCSAAYCHSNGNAAALVYAVTPNWYGTGFPAGDRCANCHGNAPNTTIAGSKSHYNNRMLGYTSQAGGHQVGIHAMSIYSSPRGLARAGVTGKSSHGNSGTATTISCNLCHYATVTTPRNDDNFVCKTCHYSGNTVGALAGNPAVIADKSRHVNGTVDVSFKPVQVLSKAQVRQKYFVTHAYSSVWTRNGGYKGTSSYDTAKAPLNAGTMWNGTTKTCSNIACHMGNSVKWTDNDGVTECISCHGSL